MEGDDIAVLLDERVHAEQGGFEGLLRLDDRGRGLPVVRWEHQAGTGDGYRGRHAAHHPVHFGGVVDHRLRRPL